MRVDESANSHGPFTLAISAAILGCDFLRLMDVNKWMSYECSDEGTSARHILRTFTNYLLVHMYQMKKIALEIAELMRVFAKIGQTNYFRICKRF
jgi:hypothetical protein